MSPFAMYGLLMRNVSVQVENEYNCFPNIVPTNPKKSVEQLTKIKTKLGSVAAHVPKNIDCHKQDKSKPGDPHNRSRSEKK